MTEKQIIDELPALVASGKITEKEALNKIAEQLYKNPCYFALHRYDEDFRSDIILTFLQKGAQTFKRFNQRTGTFSTYIFAFVQGLILTQKRNNVRKLLADTSINSFYYVPEIENAKKDSTLNVAEKQVRYTPVQNEKIWKTLSKRSDKNNISNTKTALILALKSSYYIPSDSLAKISAYCRLHHAELSRLVAELNSGLYTRIKRRNEIVKRRDNAYYFHRKYYLQMKYWNKEKIDVEALRKKYEKQTENWKQKNSELQQSRYRVCPTNKLIAKALGICERQVAYHLTRAQRLADEKEKLDAV